MNKNEFQEKLNSALKSVKQGQYENAVSVLDELDLRVIRDAAVLQNVAKAYEKCRLYDDALTLLSRARDIAPKSRGTLFHLCTVSIKAGDLDNAIRMYEEFCKIAKNDSERFVLQYRIARAKGCSDDELISILENFKGEEPDDRWIFELAKLYAQNKRDEEALELCDEILLWFDSGKYVTYAKKLRAYLTGEEYVEEPIVSATADEYVLQTVNSPLHEETIRRSEEMREENLQETNDFTEDGTEVSMPEDTDVEESEETTDGIFMPEDTETEESFGEETDTETEEKFAEETDTESTEKEIENQIDTGYETLKPEESISLTIGDEVPEVQHPEFLAEGAASEQMVISITEEEPEPVVENPFVALENEKKETESDTFSDVADTEADKIDTGADKIDTDVPEKITFVAPASDEPAEPEKDGFSPDIFKTETSDTKKEPDSLNEFVIKKEDNATFSELDAFFFGAATATAETLKSEAPMVEPKTEAPAVEPKVEAPAVEPKTEVPQEETKPETVAEIQKAETSAETAKAETPAVEPKAETPVEEQEETAKESFEDRLEKKKALSKAMGGLPIEPSVTEATWHFIVYGKSDKETLECAKEQLKELSKIQKKLPEKKVRIDASNLSGIRIIDALDQFLGKSVIIQNASLLSDSQLSDFYKILEKDDPSLLVVFTDTAKKIAEIFRRNPLLTKSFSAAFEGKHVTVADLVNTAKEYLAEKTALMTTEGEAVATQYAEKLLAEKGGSYRASMREYTAKALHIAEHGGPFGLLGGYTDDEGYLYVTEKNFRKAEKK